MSTDTSGLPERRMMKCNHLERRCVHGDEIHQVNGKRSRCLECARFLPELPEVCSVTGKPHANDEGEGK